MQIVRDNKKYGQKLIEMNFSPRLYCTDENCEDWYNHCKEHDMLFLKGSYGTIVHKDFEKYFKRSKTHKSIYEILGVKQVSISDGIDHSNIFYFKPNSKIKMITSSPYGSYNPSLFDWLKDSEYSVYVINPNVLDYYVFVERSKWTHPLSELNYAFIKPDDVICIADVLEEELGILDAFVCIQD